jgi:hypothetical protein
VPEHVWSYAAFDTSIATQPCDYIGDSLRREPSPGGVQKEGNGVGLDTHSGGKMLLLNLERFHVDREFSASVRDGV